MRKKTTKAVLIFERTVDAMAMEAFAAKENLPGRLIPLPTAISAGCGLCWMVVPEQQQEVEAKVAEHGLLCGRWYQIML